MVPSKSMFSKTVGFYQIFCVVKISSDSSVNFQPTRNDWHLSFYLYVLNFDSEIFKVIVRSVRLVNWHEIDRFQNYDSLSNIRTIKDLI